MRTTNYGNLQQANLSEDLSMHMEAHERNHVEQVYKSTKEQLLCWGEESNYLDSEFSSTLEREEQGNVQENLNEE